MFAASFVDEIMMQVVLMILVWAVLPAIAAKGVTKVIGGDKTKEIAGGLLQRWLFKK